MPFFVNPKTKKRKFEAKSKKEQGNRGNKKSKLSSKVLNEEIDSDSEVESNEASESRGRFYSSDEEEAAETPAQKRLRLAKQYLQQLEEEEADKIEEDEDASTKDAVSSRLQHDISEQKGKLTKEVADSCICPSQASVRLFRGHKLPVTCIVVSPDDKFVFTASKDCNICKWDLVSGLKVKTIKGGRKGTEDTHIGHTDHVLCMAISSDGKFLAAGDMNQMVKLWNPDDCSFVHKFKGHRGPVTGVTFRAGSHTLYSCSSDKAVKVWSVDDLAYVETLYGHNSPITGIDSLSRERAVTAGGRDRSIHIWKIPEDSQLLFYGHSGSIECVSLINEGNFFSGADDSSICVWSVLKKKPLVSKAHAHGNPTNLNSEAWITAVAALKYSDLVASGSKDGFVRLWKCGANFKTLTLVFEVALSGFINGLSFSSDGDFLVAAVGQEHRLGRWWRLKDAKNGWAVIPLRGQAAGTPLTAAKVANTENPSSPLGPAINGNVSDPKESENTQKSARGKKVNGFVKKTGSKLNDKEQVDVENVVENGGDSFFEDGSGEESEEDESKDSVKEDDEDDDESDSDEEKAAEDNEEDDEEEDEDEESDLDEEDDDND